MAIILEDEYPLNTNPADADYPQGSFKNDAVPGDLSGTPLEKLWCNDFQGFLQKLLDWASITPSGVPDTILASDYFDGLLYLFQTGAFGQNLIDNGNMEYWDLGPSAAPTGWTLIGAGATVARSATSKIGSYSAQVVYGSANADLVHAYADFVSFRGKTVSLGVWVKCSTASIARVFISDGISSNTFSDYHTGSGNWEFLKATGHLVDVAATKLESLLQIEAAGNVNFDGAKLQEGKVASAFSQRPPDFLPRGRKGIDIASASSLVLGPDGDYFDITGTTTINSIGTLGIGSIVRLHFDNALTLTHSASLELPYNRNILTAVGEEYTFVEYDTGLWRLTASTRPIQSLGPDIASANTLPVLAPGYFDITGTTTINLIAGIGIGSRIKLHFDGTLILAHSTNLILPAGVNITTAPGDEAEFVEFAAADWRCTNYTKADGFALVIQEASTTDDTFATGTTTIPNDDSIPQNTEGDQYLSLAFTPKKTTNKLKIDVTLICTQTTNEAFAVALFKDSDANALAAVQGHPSVAFEDAQAVHLVGFLDPAGTVSPITFKVRAGVSTAGTFKVNGSGASRTLGGAQFSSIRITEYRG